MKLKIAVLSGDGIGPEVTQQAEYKNSSGTRLIQTQKLYGIVRQSSPINYLHLLKSYKFIVIIPLIPPSGASGHLFV